VLVRLLAHDLHALPAAELAALAAATWSAPS
jgi:hypothetical protein